ncbi:MAG: dihydrodipicolinate synthase family protein [Betaproteobacteria bacterium]|nr:dihydrodipicolinate synthase family protein [Betaproteobacteria bacterium]
MVKKSSVVVISITPFDEKGGLDEAAFRNQLGRMREAGVSVYVCGGGSGEAYALTPEERDRVMIIAVEELKGRVPVRAMGFEPRIASEMVDFVRAAERAKVDAAQIFSLEVGHGAKPTYAEMEKYYATVIESTSLPVYLSSHRSVGYFLPLDLIESLVKRYPSIAGIAYGGSEATYLAELIKRVGDRIEVHCAGPSMALTALGLGGNGFMGGEGNLSPQLVASVISAWQAKDMDRLRVSFGKLIALNGIDTRYGGTPSSMRAMKPLMNAFGLPGGYLRPPRLPIGAAELKEVIQAVNSLELPGLRSIA